MKAAVVKIFLIVISLTFILYGEEMNEFKPVHIKRTHTIELNGAVEKIFKLFTAEGERLWVIDWSPEFYYPETENTEKGTVFVTTHGVKKTIWTCVEFDEINNYVKYVRTMHDNNTGIVSVKCSPKETGKTSAEVTYELTSLSDAGNAYVGMFTEEYYKDYINSWKTEINKYLKTL